MKIKVNQLDLFNAIEKAEKVIRKSKTPILESVLLTADNDKIQIIMNNLESAIIIDVDGYIEESGSVCIDKSNFKLIKKLSGMLTITDDNDSIMIKGNRELKFKQYDPSEYPITKDESENEAFTIIESELKDSLKIKIFAAVDNYRAALNACCINKNRIISTDGFRLAKIDLNIDNKTNKDIIIPINAILELDKILEKKSNNKLQFKYNSSIIGSKEYLKSLSIYGDGWTYTTRLIEGEYLNVDNVISVDFKTNIEVNKNELDESIGFAKDIVTDKIPVVFSIDEEFTVSAQSDSKEFKEVIDADMPVLSESDYLRTGFNPKFLTDTFKILPDDRIKLCFNSNISPLIITGNNSENETYLILPVRLAS